MELRIYTPGDPWPQDELGALRYQIYIKEQGKQYDEADHRAGVLVDALDQFSTHFVVYRTGTIVGAVRYTPLAVMDQASICREGLEALRDAPALLSICSLSSRLLVEATHRRATRALGTLVGAVYEYGSCAGCVLNFVHCRPDISSLFLRIGFRPVGPDFFYSPTGLMHHRLCLQTTATAYLKAIRSPLAQDGRRLFGCEDASDAPFRQAARMMSRRADQSLMES